LSVDDAREIGTLGVVARASGRSVDARKDHAFSSLGSAFRLHTQSQGDVFARFKQRVDEVRNSLATVRELLNNISLHESVAAPSTAASTSGLGIVEGWRGSIVCRVELDATGTLSRCRIVDPSFYNWPALSASLADTIVPDFPLVNKSFNLSYAGNDL
jgi:Ni,Fe-hydrogenase III large subunit